MTSYDPSRVIAALSREQATLDLKTVDLCFLAALYLRADKAALASFEEEALVDMFEQVCDVVDSGATAADHQEAEEAIQRVIEHVDRIAAWERSMIGSAIVARGSP